MNNNDKLTNQSEQTEQSYTFESFPSDSSVASDTPAKTDSKFESSVVNKKSTKSRMPFIVIIILLILLLGTIGFIVWQNFIQAKPADTKTINDTNKVSESDSKPIVPNNTLTEIAYDQSMGSGLAFKYPSSWVLAHTSAANVDSTTEVQTPDTNLVTSPDGAVSVELKVGVEGVGGTCDPSDNSVKLAFFDSIPISEYPGYSLIMGVNHFIEDNTYHYYANILSNDNINQTVGDTPKCSFGFFTTTNNQTSSMNIKLNNIENNTASSLQDFQTAITSDDFSIAKQIAQSLYIK